MRCDSLSFCVSCFMRLQDVFCILDTLIPVCQTKLRPVLRKDLVQELFGSTLKKRLYLQKDHISQTDNAMLGNVPLPGKKTRDLTTPCTKCCACHVKHDPVSPHQHTSCKTHNGVELSRQLRGGGERRRTQLNPHTPLNTHSEEISASVVQLWPQFFKEEVEIS